MGKNNYKAQLNYYDHTYGWGNAGTCAQGDGRTWGAGSARTGVMYFPGLSNLKGKIINSVKITVTNRAGGQNAQKTAHFFRSASQGGINTSLGAGHKTGNQIGTLSGWFHAYAAESLSFTPTFFSSYIAAGEDTFCIYSATASEYLVWGAVTLEVAWQEPATQPSLSASTVEMGKSVTINTPAVNSTYRHNIWAAFGNAGVVIAERVVSSTTWTPDVNLASQISNATSGVATIYCDTFDANGTQLGTKTISITLTVPGSVVPSAGTLSAALAEDTSGTGLYVKGMGKAKLTLSGASGAYGSNITSYTITGGGWTATNGALTTGTLASAGNITFTATVTDSRGRKASTTRTISVIDYTKPGVAVCDVYRCDADGNRKKAGTYFAVEINASYSAITGNTLSITARYKKQSESSYGTASNVTNNGKTVIGGGNIGASTTYDVLVTVADKYNSLSIPRTLYTKSVLQSFKRGAGAAIGKVAEIANWLDIAWHTRIRGNLKVDGGMSDGGYNREITNLLNINYTSSDPYGTMTNYDCVIRAEDASTLTNSPVKSGAFYAYRRTYPIWLPDKNISGVVVELHEAYPVHGRMWSRAYVKDMGGWGERWRESIDKVGVRSLFAAETLWEGSLKTGKATITNGAKYAYLIVGGWAGSNEDAVTQIIPVGWGTHMRLTSADKWLAYQCDSSGSNASITILSNPSGGSIAWVWGVNRYKE